MINDVRPDEHLLVESSELILLSAHHATGDPHESVLKFAYEDGRVYLLAHSGDTDIWYRNIVQDRGVVLRIGRRSFRGQAELFQESERSDATQQIITLFRRKYSSASYRQDDVHAASIHVQF